MNSGFLIATAHEIGSARALAPVVVSMVETGNDVRCFADGKAEIGFEESGIPFSAAGTAQTFESRVDEWLERLTRLRPSAVLTGTSASVNPEKACVLAARRLAIPVISLLDNWMNYGGRFGGPNGPLHFAPDVLCVMNETAASDLRDYGFSASAIRVTGQPYLDRVASSLPDRLRCRELLGLNSGDDVIVFASEPQAGDGTARYTEVEVLRAVVDVIRSFGRDDVFILVRPHPTERPDELQRAIEDQGLRFRVSREGMPAEVIAAADTIIGMTSLFLIEAALSGRRTASYRPGAPLDDFIGTRLGVVGAASNPRELRECLGARVDAGETSRHARSAFNVHGNSVTQIVRSVKAAMFEKRPIPFSVPSVNRRT